MQNNNLKQDRRSGIDRRAWHSNLDFPYLDCHGTLVLGDRRKAADRRLVHAESIKRSSPEIQKIIAVAN